VNEEHEEQIDGPTSARPRAEWTRPELCRLHAGGAEQGDATNADGLGNS
jgi:hypothetical protein